MPRWADAFPYVNGGLFSGSMDVPRFSKIARSYLLHIGNLDWTKINPDIFGSMIQAVAEDEERGALGMHYTSVPNILKVLNPLFLDDLRAQLEEAGDNPRTLLNLRKRMAKIRVFDPACGSGNFLVIAYKEMRAIEAEINKRRGEPDRRTEIPLTNFRGIELRDFPAEIARLALIIAEYQCDVLYRGQKEALAEFLPLDARELDHLRQRPAARLAEHLPADRDGREAARRRPVSARRSIRRRSTSRTRAARRTSAAIRRTWAASGRPTSRRRTWRAVFDGRIESWKSLDYVAGWFHEGCGLCRHVTNAAARSWQRTRSAKASRCSICGR